MSSGEPSAAMDTRRPRCAIVVGQRRGALFVGFHAHADGLGTIVLAHDQLAAAEIAHVRDLGGLVVTWYTALHPPQVRRPERRDTIWSMGKS
jgi:hypothetical protein